MDLTPLWLTALVIGRDVAIVLGVGIARLFALPVKMEPLAVGKASTVVRGRLYRAGAVAAHLRRRHAGPGRGRRPHRRRVHLDVVVLLRPVAGQSRRRRAPGGVRRYSI
ncbi:MAG: hypothetical protein WDM81_08590 [Rhizomicrobium sp.]